MAKTEGHLRRSLRIRIKHEKLASANGTATSTPASTSTNKADLPLSAAATITAIKPSDPALDNSMQAATLTETPDQTHTLEADASLPASNVTTPTAIITAVALENDTQVPTATQTLTRSHTLEDDALMPTSELNNAATIITSDTPSDLSTSLFRLPLELRDYIYIDVFINEATWIGNTPITMGYKDVIIERPTMQKPATFIKTDSSIILASSEVRDEFRTAVWRDLMQSDRHVTLKLYDLTLTPLSDFFASCSPSELQKLQVKAKCHVHIHLTGVFWQQHKTPLDGGSGSIRDVVQAWLSLCDRIGLDATYSFADSSASPALKLIEDFLADEEDGLPEGSEDGQISRTIKVMRDAAHQSWERRARAVGIGRIGFFPNGYPRSMN
jgi:hypothetical protein